MISIIVPIYNSEKHIVKCVDSILAQSLCDWELLLIDDGSTDLSPTICDKYAKKDSRIKVYHKKNGGVSSARNLGLDYAKGEYIMFVDSDDWIDCEMCESLLGNMKNNVDIVISGYKYIQKNQVKAEFKTETREITLNSLKINYDFYYEKMLINSPFAKLYRKKLIDGLRFETKLRLGEDLIFNLYYMERCRSIIFFDGTFYNYLADNIHSATKKIKDNDFEQVLYIYKIAKKFKYTYKNKQKFDAIDQRLCLNVINLMQLLYYSNRLEKKKEAKKWLQCSEFQECCRGKYNFKLRYKVPQFLFRNKCEIGLRFFFYLKKNFSGGLQ